MKLKEIVLSKTFQYFITSLILLNGVLLGLATSQNIMNSYGNIIEALDKIIIAIFTIEILMRIIVHKINFFKDPWSLFDFFVVAISLVPASGNLSILRVLRVLRLFRLLTIVPQMKTIIAALLEVIPGILSVSLVLMLFFYVFAIMATGMFGDAFPQWFGTLGESTYTLFQIMTLESWSMGIARPVMEVHPYAWIFFVIYILIVTFIMVNLFIGLIVDAIFTIKEHDKEETPQEVQLHEEIKALRGEISELKTLLKKE
ncbi:MAG: Voltage-gated sodium channel subunit [uncultured Sulfurovum sp.]|uniref:Voltage-gated sodium channel subunit n=1 Tax=uncultured Sulfurovum sp. TaxID=269237 RepID=A0A6S6SBA0_9BACT|nr:MAG: Voltage-gated sodium channel subunit [uncultured Sulfurovum sp.]